MSTCLQVYPKLVFDYSKTLLGWDRRVPAGALLMDPRGAACAESPHHSQLLNEAIAAALPGFRSIWISQSQGLKPLLQPAADEEGGQQAGHRCQESELRALLCLKQACFLSVVTRAQHWCLQS